MARVAEDEDRRILHDDSLESDLLVLRRVLGSHPFPTNEDRLMAACLARGEPTRLLWRLAALRRTKTYDSLDEVLAEVRDGNVRDVPTNAGRPD